LILIAVIVPLLAPHNPVQSDARNAGIYRQAAWIEDDDPLRTGSWTYPLGTDSIGRDVFSRLIYGARVSLLVGFITVIFTLAIGVTVGLAAGYGAHWLDNLLMRFTDVVYAFPGLLFFIIMQISFRDRWIGQALNGLLLLFITLSILSWVTVARLVRGEVLAIKEREFVEAARASGARGGQIVGRHILPNVLGPIIISGAYIIPSAISAEAVLSYLGIGVRPSVNLDAPFPTSWGNMILDGSKSWESQPWMLLAPSIVFASVTLAFTFIGDGLRDALDPHESR
jgi:oligopeptide transport system permease protein